MKGICGIQRYFVLLVLLIFAGGEVFLNNAWAGAPNPGKPGSVTVPSTDKDGNYSISWSNVALAQWYEIREVGSSNEVLANHSGATPVYGVEVQYPVFVETPWNSSALRISHRVVGFGNKGNVNANKIIYWDKDNLFYEVPLLHPDKLE